MRTLRKLVWAVLPLIAACAGVDVHTDYDAAADFSRYKTYSWVKKPATANPMMADRIVAEIDGQLYAKGWQKVPDGGDAALAAHVTSREEERIDTMYSSMGPGWYGPAGGVGAMGWAGSGMASTTVTHFTVGTLIVDVFDAKTKKGIWHATAEGQVSNDAQDTQKKITEATQKMFKEFPPSRAVGKPSP